MKHQIRLALSFMVISACVPSVQAQGSGCEPTMPGLEISSAPQKQLGMFKLRARLDEGFDPVLIDLNGPRIRPKVDANLINQIDKVKMAVPGWQGIHNIVPGAGSVAGP